jgi:hypothetical protein
VTECENSVSQCKECVSELSSSSERERARRAHQNIYRLKEILKLLNTLEERLCREGTEQRTKLLKIL